VKNLVEIAYWNYQGNRDSLGLVPSNICMPLYSLALLSILCAFFFAPKLRAAPFEVSPGISTVFPHPDETLRRDTLLAVDVAGDHHFVSLNGVPGEDHNTLIYYREKGEDLFILNSLPDEFRRSLLAIATTATGEVILLTYSIRENGGALSSRGCALYHLNGPAPTEPRLVIPTTSRRDAIIAPLEDGSVLIATQTASRIEIGRLLADSFVYEELGGFSPGSSQDFTTVSVFVETDQTVHLAATTREEIAADDFSSRLLYRRFDLENLAENAPWQIVTSDSSATSSIQIANHHDIAVTNEIVIVYVDEISSKLRSARKTLTGWDFSTLQSSTNIGRLIVAPDELGTLTAAWDFFGDGTVRYRTLSEMTWSPGEMLPLTNFASFATDRGGYLHAAGQWVATIPGEGNIPFYRSLRPLDVTDEDRDGLPYVLEEVLGSDPNAPDFGSLVFDVYSDSMASLSTQVVSDLAPVELSQTCFHSKDTNIEIKVESSNDLSVWREAIGQVESELFSIVGSRSAFVTTFQDPAPETPRRFIRLKATRIR